MTATFTDFVAYQDACNTIQLNVTKWTLMLCDALKQNYIDYSIRSHERSLFRDFGETSVAHHESCLKKLKNGKCDYSYIIESGRKYHKIIMVIDNGPGRNVSRSCHAFVDKQTGSVLKSASWKAPSKGERFNLLNGGSRDHCYHLADWSGSYLYAK